jgi:predicted nucleic acid-binding protein
LRKRRRWNDEEIELLVDFVALAAALTPGDLEVNAMTATEGSPTPNKVLACLVEGQADCVVVSDDHLLKLERHSLIVILPPRHFLDRFERGQESDVRSPSSYRPRGRRGQARTQLVLAD